jgi:hypothetical protein
MHIVDVNGKKERAKDRSLGDSTGDLHVIGCSSIESNALGTVG